jgi:hypothetical protein
MAKKRTYKFSTARTGGSFPVLNCKGFVLQGMLNDPNVAPVSPPAGTAFSAGTATKLTNIHVQLIFWGAWWNSNPLAGQINAAVTNLLAGPYMTYLAQYGVRRGNVRGMTFANDSEPGSFTLANVGKFLADLLDSDRLPEPDDDWPIVYAVIMPTNATWVGTPAGFNGENSSGIWSDYDLGDVDNSPAYYLWAGTDGTVDYVTTVLSHELAEIATDPNGGDGVLQIGCTSQCQIGDVATVCQPWCDYVRGVKAQGYWSILDGNGVLPKMYSIRRTLTGKSIGGKLPRPNPSVNAWITAQF